MARQALSEPHSQMTLLVPSRIKDWLVDKAARNDRSLNKEVARLLSQLMNDQAGNEKTV